MTIEENKSKIEKIRSQSNQVFGKRISTKNLNTLISSQMKLKNININQTNKGEILECYIQKETYF